MHGNSAAPFRVAGSDELFEVVDHSSVLQQLLALLCKGGSFFSATASRKGLTRTAFLKLERPELSVSNLPNTRLSYSCMPRRGGFLILLAHTQGPEVISGCRARTIFFLNKGLNVNSALIRIKEKNVNWFHRVAARLHLPILFPAPRTQDLANHTWQHLHKVVRAAEILLLICRQTPAMNTDTQLSWVQPVELPDVTECYRQKQS